MYFCIDMMQVHRMLLISVIIYTHELHHGHAAREQIISFNHTETDWLIDCGIALLCTALLAELISYCYKSIESWTFRFDGLIVRRNKIKLLEFFSKRFVYDFTVWSMYFSILSFINFQLWWVMNHSVHAVGFFCWYHFGI